MVDPPARRAASVDLDQRQYVGTAAQCRAQRGVAGLEVGAMPAKGVEERAAFADAMTLLCALIGAAIGLAIMLSSRDAAMAFHGFVFDVAGALAAIFILKTSFETSAP